MKTIKVILSSLAFFALCSSHYLRAGAEGRVSADPNFTDGGNTWRLIGVPANGNNTVLISSRATDVGLSIWRYRTIVNVSTCALALYPDANTFSTYVSSFGIVLSSGSNGLGQGDSWLVTHQGPVWGIWSGGCQNGPGAGGVEAYEKR